jgi:hypothetical protein
VGSNPTPSARIIGALSDGVGGFTVAKLALRRTEPFTFLALRFAIATILLLSWRPP